MRSQPPALMPILRSRHQAELLTWLFLHPGEEYTLGEMSVRLAVSPSTLHAEVERLTTAGFVDDRYVGRTRLLRANTTSRLAAPLTELLTLSFGPHVVVAEEFNAVPGVKQVVLYGSWAARYEGVVGKEPADVDVMVIGKPDREDIYAAADRCQQRLGLEVNPTIRSAKAWREAADALVVTVKDGPHLLVVEHEGAAA